METEQDLRATVNELRSKLQTLEDIEQIRKLQGLYGYYLDNFQWSKIIDLFSENTESLEVADRGFFLGKAGVKKFFTAVLERHDESKTPWVFSVHMQLQGIINIDPDGVTAKGRWHGWLIEALPLDGKPMQFWAYGVYENVYIKEDTAWKFKKLHFNLTFRTPYEEGWLKRSQIGMGFDPLADGPSTAFRPYPSGYYLPYHWESTAGR